MCHLCVSRYSIERSSDPDKYFYMDITSGALMTVRSLDREEIGWHNITVLAMEMSTSHAHIHVKPIPSNQRLDPKQMTGHLSTNPTQLHT